MNRAARLVGIVLLFCLCSEAGLFLTLPVRPAPRLTPVSFAWDPEPEAAGFNVYWGPASGFYTNVASVGKVTSCTISVGSGPQFFAATAYDSSGWESDFSEEAVFTPAPALTNSVRLGFVAWRSASRLVTSSPTAWVTNEVLVLCETNAPADEFDQVVGWREVVTNF